MFRDLGLGIDQVIALDEATAPRSRHDQPAPLGGTGLLPMPCQAAPLAGSLLPERAWQSPPSIAS
jgi:hypothetical protein